MSLGVKLLDVLSLGGSEALVPLRELLVEFGSITLLEEIEVSLNVSTKDVVLVNFGLVLNLLVTGISFDFLAALVGNNLGFNDLVAGETLFVVRDVETTIAGTLHAAEDTVTSCGANETDIEMGFEGAAVLVHFIANREELAINGSLTLVHVSHTLEGEQAASEQKTSGVSGRVVGETSGDVELSELLGVSSAHGAITLNGSVNNLGDNSAVGSADTEAVLLLVVLVFVLED